MIVPSEVVGALISKMFSIREWIVMGSLIVGIGTIALGARQQSLARVNLGMSVVAIQIVVRFFSSELGFVARGLAFIVVGLGFLLANFVLTKKMRSENGGDQ